MAIVEIKELAEGRRGSRGQAGRRTYERTMFVTTNDAYTSAKAICDDPQLPVTYEHYSVRDANGTIREEDKKAVLLRKTPEQVGNNRLLWKVRLEYDSEYEVRDNPFLEPPDISFDTESYEEALYARTDVHFDPNASQNPEQEDPLNADVPNGWIDGDFCTSAGEPFDPPVMDKKTRGIITYTHNETTNTSALLVKKLTYENSVNYRLWSGFQPRIVWLRSIKATSHVQKSTTVGIDDTYFFRVSYQFALNPKTWDLVLPDVGSFYRDYTNNPNGEIKNFTTRNGTPMIGRLDHSDHDEPGQALAAGENVQFLVYSDRFPRRDFNELGIFVNIPISQMRTRPRF